jgi:lipoyl(octanoyl) transferase
LDLRFSGSRLAFACYHPRVGQVTAYRLGTIGYADALALQQRLAAERVEQRIPDTLLLLEHTPVITLGRGGKRDHVLASEGVLKAQGVELFETGRGGDVTYHGPGQLVGYPILDLSSRRDVRRYVHDLEQVMIDVAARFGVSAARIAGLNGAWVGDRKLGAVGVRIQRWITLHGFALNVSTDLSAFDLIVPCGIKDKQVTSLGRELGAPPAMDAVEAAALAAFASVFDARVELRAGAPAEP